MRAHVVAARRVTSGIALIATLLMFSGGDEAISADLDAAQRDAITSIVFDSAITLRAKERRASKEIGELYTRLSSVTHSALSHAEKHRREISIKDRIIRELETADRVYAAQIQAFKGSLQDLSQSPEATQILVKYQSGDKGAALAELEAFIAARQRLRTAAAQALHVADLRAEAALSLDAADKAEIEVTYAIKKLEALAREEADNWRTWLTLFGFYFSDAQYSQAHRCLVEVNRIVAGDHYDLGPLFAHSADSELSDQLFHEEAASKGVQLELREFKRHHLNYLLSIEDPGAEHIIVTVRMGEILERTYAEKKGPALNRRGDFENGLTALGGPAAVGAVCAAIKDVPALRGESGTALAAQVILGPPRPFLSNIAIERAVRDLCAKQVAEPRVARHARQLGFVFERLGRLYYKGGDRQMATLLYLEANAIDRKLLAEHPASSDLRRNLATSTFNLAMADTSLTRWGEACAVLEQLRLERRLMRRDQPYRDLACQKARRGAEP